MTEAMPTSIKNTLMTQIKNNRQLLCDLKCDNGQMMYLDKLSNAINEEDDSPAKIERMAAELSGINQEIVIEYRKHYELSAQKRNPCATGRQNIDSGFGSACFRDSMLFPIQESIEQEKKQCDAEEHSMEDQIIVCTKL